jgi:hypothetical protein
MRIGPVLWSVYTSIWFRRAAAVGTRLTCLSDRDAADAARGYRGAPVLGGQARRRVLPFAAHVRRADAKASLSVFCASVSGPAHLC